MESSRALEQGRALRNFQSEGAQAATAQSPPRALRFGRVNVWDGCDPAKFGAFVNAEIARRSPDLKAASKVTNSGALVVLRHKLLKARSLSENSLFPKARI